MTIYTYDEVASWIDHSLLTPTLTTNELEAGCALALRYRVASVCILPFYLKRCRDLLEGSTVRPSTTVGFPHGGHTTACKAREAQQALEDGAMELDVVVNVNKVKSSDWKYVRSELKELVDGTHGYGQKIKVIFENAYLTDEEKIALCRMCSELGADWVKTSTGFAPSGANVADVALLRLHSAESVGVKAAGGIGDLDSVFAMHAAGANRVGSSRTERILEEYERRFGEGGETRQRSSS